MSEAAAILAFALGIYAVVLSIALLVVVGMLGYILWELFRRPMGY